MLYNLSKGGIIMSFENKGYVPQFFGDDRSTKRRKEREKKTLNTLMVLLYIVLIAALFYLMGLAINL